jgi:DNA-binding NtrC family response regulator
VSAPGDAVRGLVLVAEDNLFLRPKLETALTRAGWAVRVVTDVAGLEEVIEDGPVALFVNVGSTRLPWTEMVVAARRQAGPDFPVLGYGPHVDKPLFERGVELGCTKVLPNGLVAADAARVLEQHAGAL